MSQPQTALVDGTGQEGEEEKSTARLLTVLLRQHFNFFSDISSFENLLTQNMVCIISSILEFLRYVAVKLQASAT